MNIFREACQQKGVPSSYRQINLLGLACSYAGVCPPRPGGAAYYGSGGGEK